MSELIPFLNRHAGESAWLFGKGPSLTTFDFTTAGPLRAAINDVIAHVPDCLYGFANDNVRRWRDAYRPGQILFQPRRCLWEYEARPIGADCQVVLFDDERDDERLFLPREELASSLSIRRGTLQTAIQILHLMGVSNIHLVGIDGGPVHAPGLAWCETIQPHHFHEYDAIRREAIDCASFLRIPLTFHPPTAMDQPAEITVKITRDSLALGAPYSAGQIVSFPSQIAFEMIAADAAVRFTTPEKPQPETAELKNAKETAARTKAK